MWPRQHLPGKDPTPLAPIILRDCEAFSALGVEGWGVARSRVWPEWSPCGALGVGCHQGGGIPLNERIGELLVQARTCCQRSSCSQAQREGCRVQGRTARRRTSPSSGSSKRPSSPTSSPSSMACLRSISTTSTSIPRWSQLMPEDVAMKHNVVPVNRAGSTLILATAIPRISLPSTTSSSSPATTSSPSWPRKRRSSASHREVLRAGGRARRGHGGLRRLGHRRSSRRGRDRRRPSSAARPRTRRSSSS